MLLFIGCEDEPETFSLPVVQSLEITNITTTSATCSGVVISDGGAQVTARGVCWDTSPQPTTSLLTKTFDGPDTGMFVSELTNLLPNQQYYLRAYGTNAIGTAYGEALSFSTNPYSSIVYKPDGRTVKLGDPFPIALDLTEDGLVDFTVFMELTANTKGDRLYAGINPIGPNLIKSGPSIEENYLSMGLLIAENFNSTIDDQLEPNQQWTGNHGALIIRNTSTLGNVSYEGSWAAQKQIVGIQNHVHGSIHFGWLQLTFDKETEIVTLIDYAYDSIAGQSIKAGAIAN